MRTNISCKGVKEKVEWSETESRTDGNEEAERVPTRRRSARIGEAAPKRIQRVLAGSKSARKLLERNLRVLSVKGKI